MKNSTGLRVTLAFLMFVLGTLQAWDSNVHDAGLMIVLLVSLAIPLVPMALLVQPKQAYMIAALVLALVLLVLARLLAPIPLPGLFIILVPAAMGLIFSGLLAKADG